MENTFLSEFLDPLMDYLNSINAERTLKLSFPAKTYHYMLNNLMDLGSSGVMVDDSGLHIVYGPYVIYFEKLAI